ncbi:MAG: IS91 family transposase, partial [Sphingomonas sp.]|nr:IS91 family transposase [Sphingomonas sp.]
PKGFHRIRHYGLLASGTRKENLERARQLLGVAPPAAVLVEPTDARLPCACCGGQMVIIETFERRYQPRAPPFSTASSGRPAS